MPTTPTSQFCQQSTEPEFNLKTLTARLLVAPDADTLLSLTRFQRLSLLLNLLLKGAPREIVEHLHYECLTQWEEVSCG